jgi:protein SCO1/2
MISCSNSPKVIHDLSDTNYNLVDQDSAAVNFPANFEGKYVVMAFIYTHCPDICNITTANLKNMSNQFEDKSDVHFLAITFDPERDTPSVLNDYMQTFTLDAQYFTMLTGTPTEIDSVLSRLDIEAKKSFTKTNAQGEKTYFMYHTDRVSVMDPQGRVRFEYPGSRVPPEHVVEDVNKLRSWWPF